MSDPDTGDFDGLPPQEALDQDERLDGDDDTVDPPERWHGANQYGTTPAEEAAGEPLDMRLAQERPDDEPVDVPDRPVAVTPIDELDESVDEAFGTVDEPDERGDPGDPDEFVAIDEVGGMHEVNDSEPAAGSLN